MSVDQQTQRMKNAAERKEGILLAKLFIELHRSDPDFWITTLREQRVVEKLRDLEAMNSFLNEVAAVLFPFQVTTFEAVRRHVDVCLFSQRVYDFIDSETTQIEGASVNNDSFHKGAVSVSELWAERLRRIVDDQINGGMRPTEIHQFAHVSEQVRTGADWCVTLLCSSKPRRSSSSTTTLTDTQFDRLIQLADLYLKCKSIFDKYTYGRLQLDGISRHQIAFRNDEPMRDVFATVAAERSGVADYSRRAFTSLSERALEKKLSLPEDDSTFEEYFLQNREAVSEMQNFGNMIYTDLVSEVEDFLDTDGSFSTPFGELAVADLTACWSVLRVIGAVASNWRHKRSWKALREQPVAVIRVGICLHLIDLFLECGLSKARSLLRQFRFDANHSPQDLFYKPMLPIEGGRRLVVPVTFLESSRYERNLLALLVTDKILDQNGKGSRAVIKVVESFRDADFIAVADVNLRLNGSFLTDVDVLAFKGKTLFMAQVKVVIEPDSIYEVWKAEKRLLHAAEQLRSCEAHLDLIVAELGRRFPGQVMEFTEVFSFVATNTRHFTESKVGGYPVVDLPYLHFILNGATPATLATSEDSLVIGNGASFISGEFPTEHELKALLEQTIHKIIPRYKGQISETLSVGSLQIVAPVTTLHPSPHPFLRVGQIPEA